LIPPPKNLAFRGGPDGPTAQFRGGDMMVNAGQTLDLQLQVQAQQVPSTCERESLFCAIEKSLFSAQEREREM